MVAKIFRDKDADLALLKDEVVAVIGYGTQGTSRALNMRDSGLKVIVGADNGHTDWTRAVKDGFEVMVVEDAAKRCEYL